MTGAENEISLEWGVALLAGAKGRSQEKNCRFAKGGGRKGKNQLRAGGWRKQGRGPP